MNARPIPLLIFLLASLALSCSPRYTRFTESYSNSRAADTGTTYASLQNWAAHPQKHDPSDSIPAPLLASHQQDSSVDVFFIHPTSFTDRQDSNWNAALSDAAINAKTDYTSILYQASAFNEFNVYAPRYRQANIRSYFVTDTARALQAFNLAYQDVKAAFEYYIRLYNQGRPFIIASHSQGSNHAQRLIKEVIENTPLQEQLVVSYILGMYLPANYFNSTPPCRDTTKTGCVIAWRTYKQGYEPEFIAKETVTSVVVNPLTWTTGDGYAPASSNKGSILRNFNKLNQQVSGARIHHGMLWIDKLHIPGGFLIRMKNFHIADVNLFYLNIRDDLRRRVRNYKLSRPDGPISSLPHA